MRYVLSLLFCSLSTAVIAQNIKLETVNQINYDILEDVMELTDSATVYRKLADVESEYNNDSSFVSRLRLGIIYHEAALNLLFLETQPEVDYAAMSYDIFSDLQPLVGERRGFDPVIDSYKASALSMVAAASSSLRTLNESFDLFSSAVDKYSDVSYLPRFLRGSVAENLPWFFFRKKAAARNDFSFIIDQYRADSNYASPKIMSFTLWAWANNHQHKKHRNQALNYLKEAIALDPDYEAGRAKAEALITQLNK